MSIEVKRSCNTSVRLTPDRVNFNCITISLTGIAAEYYHKITTLYPDMKDTELLADLVAYGIGYHAVKFMEKEEEKE